MSLTPRLQPLKTYDLCLNGGFAAVALVALLGISLGVFQPLHQETVELAARTQELRQLVQRTSEITHSRQQLERQVLEKEQATTDLLQRMPLVPHESEFLAQVCQLANETGFEIADYHPGAVESLENHHEMEVKISARGDFAAVCRFLDQTTRLPRLCRLVRVEIGGESPEHFLPVDLTFRIYFAPST